MMIKSLFYAIKHGFYDDDPMTSIADEILVMLGFLKGSYSRIINNALKQYGGINSTTGKPNFSLGAYVKRSDGDVWSIRRQPGAKSDTVLSLGDEIEENLTRVNCFRRVAIEAKPLRLILYHKKPTPITFNENFEEIKSVKKNQFIVVPGVHWKGRNESLVAIDTTEEKFCHMLIAGVTGSGKSQLLLSMILSLAITNDPQHVSMLVIDPKGMDFVKSKVEELPHLMCKPIVDLTEAEEAIHKVRLELDRRRLSGDSTLAKKAIFIFCDEIASFAEHKQATADLTLISQQGRAWNIHVIAATQRPTKQSLDTTLRSQLVCNFTGSVTSPEEAKYATGHAESGADRLPGSGAFVLNCPQYFNHRVQGLLTDGYGLIVDDIRHEYKGQQSHFLIDNDGIDVGEEKTAYGGSGGVKSVSRAITSREEFVEELIRKKKDGEEITDSKIRDYHKEKYDKAINGNTSKIILEYILSN